MTRVGCGFDAHAFGPGDSVVLAGVEIPHVATLVGHSDGDVVAHAVADAMLGAAAMGDLGTHFPATPEWEGRSSLDILVEVSRLVTTTGLGVGNVDVTVIAQAPQISPHVVHMRELLAAALGTATEAVSVKATTTDALGFTGRGEGIAALAVVLLLTP